MFINTTLLLLWDTWGQAPTVPFPLLVPLRLLGGVAYASPELPLLPPSFFQRLAAMERFGTGTVCPLFSKYHFLFLCLRFIGRYLVFYYVYQ